MRRKRSLTLIEIVICMVLVGFLLTGLFNSLRQGLKKNVEMKGMKQKVLQLELFHQRVKNLFANLGDVPRVYFEKHPDAVGNALMTIYKNPADPEPEMCGNLKAMLFLNKNHEICLASWSETGKGRIEVLLDKVENFNCRLFDQRKKEWGEQLSGLRKRETPPMITLELLWDGHEIPFAFFSSAENIIYPSQ